MKEVFFAKPRKFRKWLAQNHARVRELWVGFYKKDSGKPSITYNQAVDEALCYGWIDGVRKSIDVDAYTIRFSPRKPKSIWSAVNIKRVGELEKLGRMAPPGLVAFRERDPARSGKYSYESRPRKLAIAYEREFKRNKTAWAFFLSEAPSYQRTVSFWVMSAQKEETRARRLAILIRDSEQAQKSSVFIVSKSKRR